LLSDFDELKSSGILAEMALIQNVLEERHKARKTFHRSVEGQIIKSR